LTACIVAFCQQRNEIAYMKKIQNNDNNSLYILVGSYEVERELETQRGLINKRY